MGCSNNKEATIHELNSMVLQIKKENQVLKGECDKLKSNKDLNSCQESFDSLLMALDNLAAEIGDGESRITDVKLDDVEKYEELLNGKIKRIKGLIEERESVIGAEVQLDEEIKNTEKIVKSIENSFFSADEKGNFIEELDKAGDVLKELNEDIKKSGLNFTGLTGLEIDEEDIGKEIEKIDKEIEELNEEMRDLKRREDEIKNLENLVKRNNLLGPKNDLDGQIAESLNRIEMLELEKNRVKEEISKIKKASVMDTEFDGKLEELNKMIEKRRNRPKNEKVVNDVLYSDVEATLMKAKMFVKDFKK